MPELPDVEDYLAALRPRVLGQQLERIRVTGISLLKSWDPPMTAAEGLEVTELCRLGKRLVFGLGPEDPDERLYLVLHLMVAGRLAWKDEHAASVPRKVGLAAMDFPHGTLLIREAAKKKRASLHLVRGQAALRAHDPGGLEPLEIDEDAFAAALTNANRTLKRALTDPRTFSGIGNAFSDEILLRARLSPVQRTRQLDRSEIARLHRATIDVLTEWVQRLRERTGDGFPTNVTAFRPEFGAHGKFGEPCPECGTAIQRIVYAENEVNYCPACQTGGKVLADRSLSRILKDDWPRTVEELEGG